MDQQLLHLKMQETRELVRRAGLDIPDDSFSASEKLFGVLSGWDAVRINPISFAQGSGVPLRDVFGIFIYGSKSGLFRFEWNLLCPYCGGREHSHASLNQLEKVEYHCTMCDLDVAVEADSHLEVSFSLNEQIGGSAPDLYASLQDYSRYHFSPNLVLPPELYAAFTEQPRRRYLAIGPRQTGKISGTLTGPAPSDNLRVVTLDTHAIFNARVTQGESQGVQSFTLLHTETGFAARETLFRFPGRFELIIRNASSRPIGIVTTWVDSEKLLEVYARHPAYFKPFVTGKMMLNNQYFRDLFLVDNLPDDLSLKVSDVTLMFTDLKGSTELYTKTGDVQAYRLVQKHFSLLHEIVRSRDGAVVKTMGDAIMASFNKPDDGIGASLEMLDRIDAFNRSGTVGENAIGLKIGLHRGPAIAVKANQTLDYFGQTVNVAARVQALADAGELWITADIARESGLEGSLAEKGLTLVPHEVALKGVGSKVDVFQCRSR